MIKIIEAIIIITLLIFAFFAGVKYSDSVENHASWLFESKSDEVELPDLSNSGKVLEEVVASAVDQDGNIIAEVPAEAATGSEVLLEESASTAQIPDVEEVAPPLAK
jgi:hypothetical protein